MAAALPTCERFGAGMEEALADVAVGRAGSGQGRGGGGGRRGCGGGLGAMMAETLGAGARMDTWRWPALTGSCHYPFDLTVDPHGGP